MKTGKEVINELNADDYNGLDNDLRKKLETIITDALMDSYNEGFQEAGEYHG